MEVHLCSKNPNLGREIQQEAPSNINSGYFLIKVFKLPLKKEVRIIGNGKKTLLEILGVNPKFYEYEFNFRIKSENNLLDFYGLNGRLNDLEKDTKAQINNLIDFYKHPKLTINFGNYQDISKQIINYNCELSNFANIFEYLLNSNYLKESFENGKIKYFEHSECCGSETKYKPLSSDFIEKYSSSVKGFKRLSLFASLSGDLNERGRAITVLEEEQINPLKKQINLNVKYLSNLKSNLENF